MISLRSLVFLAACLVVVVVAMPMVADPLVWDLQYEPFGPDDIPTVWIIQGGAFILAIVITISVGFCLVRRLVRRARSAL